MSNVIKLEDSALYRAILSKLCDNNIDSRQKFIDSLSMTQYAKFNKSFRCNRLDFDIQKVTKDSRKIALFNSWKDAAHRWNVVQGTVEQEDLGYTGLCIITHQEKAA